MAAQPDIVHSRCVGAAPGVVDKERDARPDTPAAAAPPRAPLSGGGRHDRQGGRDAVWRVGRMSSPLGCGLIAAAVSRSGLRRSAAGSASSPWRPAVVRRALVGAVTLVTVAGVDGVSAAADSWSWSPRPAARPGSRSREVLSRPWDGQVRAPLGGRGVASSRLAAPQWCGPARLPHRSQDRAANRPRQADRAGRRRRAESWLGAGSGTSGAPQPLPLAAGRC